MIYRLCLPYPPSSNRYWRYFRGRTVVSREAKDYRDIVAVICTQAGLEPLMGDIGVNIRVYRPRKSGDLDNRQKIVWDALQGNAFLNDSQIVEIHAFRHDDKNNPRIEVDVWQVE